MLGKDITICIVGNKCDLEKDRNVSRDEAIAYAKAVGATHFETSAKKYINVDEVFHHLTQLMISAAKGGDSGATGATGIVRPGSRVRRGGPEIGEGDSFADPEEAKPAD